MVTCYTNGLEVLDFDGSNYDSYQNFSLQTITILSDVRVVSDKLNCTSPTATKTSLIILEL